MFPYKNVINIDKDSKMAVYIQIANAIVNGIRNGTLKAGTHLPGSRELARILSVHRKTVIAAYDELDAQGWINIFPRRYVAVSERIPSLNPRKWNPANSVSYGSDLALPFNIIDKEATGHPTISPTITIDDGCPDVRLCPIDTLLKTYRSLTSRNYGITNANTSTGQGTIKFREELANYLSLTRGLNISAENLLVTHGAQMSIYLSAQLLLGLSKKVIVGKPNYPIANKTFGQTGAEIIEVNVDQNGIDTDAIERICKNSKVDAVYVIPHHHYPTTVTLSIERRMQLLELSKRYSFVIIEDDYDYDFHYLSSPYLPLASADHAGNVIYIGSFSKILDPSLRVGFMVAPMNFIRQAVALRKLIDVAGDGYMQNAIAALINGGELKRHLKKAKKTYHQRMNFLDKLFKERLASYVSYTLPTGGMAIWVKLREDLSVTELFRKKGLVHISRYYEGQNAFRFGFASMDESELDHAVSVLHGELRKIEKL